jgi:hypothetical protein
MGNIILYDRTVESPKKLDKYSFEPMPFEPMPVSYPSYRRMHRPFIH